MSWLAVLATVAALLVALLAVPVRFRVAAAMAAPEEPFRRRAMLDWGFGLVQVPLGRAGVPARRTARRKRPQRRPSRFGPARLLTDTALRQRSVLLLRRLLATVRWQRLRLDARFGLDDPADTGMLWGLAAPFLTTLLPSRSNVTVRPEFAGAALAFDGECDVRLVPLQVVWVLLTFAASPATWRALWPVLRRR